MDGTRATSADVRVRLTYWAELLSDFARIMAEQAEFHTSERVDYSLNSVREGVQGANRRLQRIDAAGGRWIREAEKTMLMELAMAVSWADGVLAEAGDEAWPDLNVATENAREAIHAISIQMPELFIPADFNAQAVLDAPAAEVEQFGWHKVKTDCFMAVGTTGIPMSVVKFSGRGKNATWLVQVGGIGVGFFTGLETAIEKAVSAYDRWFGSQEPVATAPEPVAA